jgi:hypothetical protein
LPRAVPNETAAIEAARHEWIQASEQLERAKTMVTQFLIGRLVHLRTANRDSLEGQGLVEYALIILLVAIGALIAVTAMGATVRETLYGLIEDVLIPVLGG